MRVHRSAVSTARTARPARARPSEHPVLALQRAAGNRAVAAALANAGALSVQRACGPSCGCATCGGGGGDEEAEASRRTVQRSVARPPVVVQTMPAYNPKNTWTKKDKTQGPHACEVLPETLAQARWLFWSKAFPAEAGSRCGCPKVEEVWDKYFEATGGSFTFGDDCVTRQLKNDDDHLPFEEPIMNQVAAKLATFGPKLVGKNTARIPFADAAIDTSSINNLTYNHNTRAGGSLFGGVGESEFGPDTRDVAGTIEIDKEVDPRNRLFATLRPRVELAYHVTDGVDFCPGNTGEAAAFIVQNAVTIVSQLEASGMARDVKVDASYTRIRNLPPKQIPNPDLISPDPPKPKTVTVPAKALFDFGSAELKPDAQAAIVLALGDAPDRAAADQPVVVVGHTDSRGTDAINLPLSRERAEAVKRFLEKRYPHLAGKVTAEGRGSREPVEPNEVDGHDNPEGRRKNRRVEITLQTTQTAGP